MKGNYCEIKNILLWLFIVSRLVFFRKSSHLYPQYEHRIVYTCSHRLFQPLGIEPMPALSCTGPGPFEGHSTD